MAIQAHTVGVYRADKSTLLVNLHNVNSATDVRLLWLHLGAASFEESWLYSWDSPDGELAKSQDRPRKMKIALRLPPVTNMQQLRTKLETVRDSFQTTGNYLRVKYVGDSADRFYYIYQSRIDPVTQDFGVAQMVVNQGVRVDKWEFEFTTKSKADGQAYQPVI